MSATARASFESFSLFRGLKTRLHVWRWGTEPEAGTHGAVSLLQSRSGIEACEGEAVVLDPAQRRQLAAFLLADLPERRSGTDRRGAESVDHIGRRRMHGADAGRGRRAYDHGTAPLGMGGRRVTTERRKA